MEDSLLNADMAATPAIADAPTRDPAADATTLHRKRRKRAALEAAKEIEHEPEGREPESAPAAHLFDSLA